MKHALISLIAVLGLPACDDGGLARRAGTPAKTSAAPAEPMRVVVGGGVSCVIYSDGKVRCWGDNTYGQLSPSLAFYDFLYPREVPELKDVRDLDFGGRHTCAIVGPTGQVVCQGSNEAYQLGVEGDPATTVVLKGLPPARAISASAFSTAIVDENGNIWDWGDCDLVEGFCTPDHRRMEFSERWLAVVAGGVECGISATRAGWCWKYNGEGALGTGVNDLHTLNAGKKYPPTQLPNVTSLTQIDPTCAVDTSQRVFCWGMNYSGRLGLGTVGDLHDTPATPHEVPNLRAVNVESAGIDAVCALEPDGHVSCWGYAAHGALGNGPPPEFGSADVPSPQRVEGLEHVKQLAGSGTHVCAFLEDNSVKCWGENEVGQLGNGHTTNWEYRPVNVLLDD